MTKIKSWISAFRLRTLPLAISSILMGSFLAIASDKYNSLIITLSIVTTLLLQILSNLANDYGDGMKGTDNIERLGPKRTIQSGEISPNEMRVGIILFVLLSLISGIWLIIESFGSDWHLALLFLAFGLASIAAAIKYTVGNKAYGYSGLGDLFVFLFFGFLAVMGSYYLNTLTLSWVILLPTLSMGFLSTGVLNLNNMRDIKNDLQSGKNTLASSLGFESAKKYHIFLVSGAMIAAIAFSTLNFNSIWNYLYLISFPLFVFQLFRIVKIKEEKLMDPFLKQLALTTLLFAVLFGLGLIL